VGRRRDLFPPDRGLQARMLVVIVLDATLALALAAGLIYLTLFVPYGWSLTVWPVVLIAVGVSAFARASRQRRGTGRAPTPRDAARARHALQRLCVIGDLPEPRVKVVRDRMAQSWTVATPRRRPRVFVTTALLDVLDEGGLEAVLAHELGHIAHRDALVMSLAAAPGIWLLRGIRRTWEQAREDDELSVVVLVALLLPLALVAALFPFLARILSRARELAADATAARLAGSPAAVAAALAALSDDVRRKRRNRKAGAAPDELTIVPLRPARGIARMWAPHPPLERRIAALERMETRLQRGPYSP
jgi:heat shock protein HtpX